MSDLPANDGNVVSLQSAQRERAGNDRRQKARNQEIEAAIRESRFEAWFQPVLSLPQRKSRYLHGVPYLAQQRGPAMQPSEWMRIAQKLGSAAAVDHFMLLQGLKLVRDLKRNGKPCGVIWRIGRASFQDAEQFEAMAEILKANVAVNGLFVCEVTLSDYKHLTNPELDRLFMLREAGYRICLGDCSDPVALSRTLKTRIFDMAALDAAALIQAGGFGVSAGAELSTTIEVIATGVASEADAIALIDFDVSLAQGPLFSPPRPLRRDLGAPGAPEGVA
jgi:cyclic-di-GMP phosphodiesterase TipF (flagellum assembly factor)